MTAQPDSISPTSSGNGTVRVASRLNRFCLCPQQELKAEATFPRVAAAPLYIAQPAFEAMRDTVAAIHRVAALPGWRAAALAEAPASAAHDPGYPGVLFGYDFHLGGERPQLIEINSNAGGALISTALLAAQNSCCRELHGVAPAQQADEAECAILDSFRREWHQARGDTPLRRIAIVDEKPQEQYLFPEFLRFVALFAAAGIESVVCDPRELQGDAAGLTLHGQPIDLVYNRLTDFYLEAPHLAPLREAYLAGRVVLTPHPQSHALYADKRHLVRLSDAATLAALGAAEQDIAQITSHVPPTQRVTPDRADELWRNRRRLFFKPVAAYGSHGAYEGAKLTRTVFEKLLHEDYVAQEMAAPSMRHAVVENEVVELKADVRCYVYDGAIQLIAARLYRGQTTNFRTPGGGFATVCVTAG
ncbi:MAG: hypothetical protein CVV05_14005 [Gammaproteobacteria bacterium HGW-Gammaproteobacteria-1]|nr:MAG: hypothetical protein CVV05_14005 [Gammaproteobacteria bacterium HGW-Gammaproteobacteria-1]